MCDQPLWSGRHVERNRTMRLDDLADFAAVARARSFTRAAAGLRVSTSALSHTIKQLEARLGVRLLQRTSRSVSVTAAGERLLQTLEPALADIGGALDELGRQRDLVSGTVRVTATRHAFETIIRPVLPEFLASHPNAGVEVLIDYQFRDIVAERFDAGIRLGEKLQQDMIAVAVGPDLRMAVVASPDYLARHPAPGTPQELMRHACVNWRMMASGQILNWQFERDGRAGTQGHRSTHVQRARAWIGGGDRWPGCRVRGGGTGGPARRRRSAGPVAGGLDAAVPRLLRLLLVAAAVAGPACRPDRGIAARQTFLSRRRRCCR